MFSFEPDFFIPVMIFALPIIAVMGGIVTAVVKILGRQRMAELVHRERIAAIERGVDPAKLAPVFDAALASADGAWHNGNTRSRAQGLLIGGLVTSFAGLGLMTFLIVLRPDGSDAHNVWAVGLIPLFVGAALLISAWLVWPRDRPAGGTGS
jgi:hypothetical protein